MSIENPTLAHFRHFSSLFTNLRSTTVENSLQITPFYAKQTQFYTFFAPKRRFHEKTNPIQSQFKPNLTQNKPNLSQNKPNSNPIFEREQMNAHAWKMNLTIILIVLLADLTTLKGANSNPICLLYPVFCIRFQRLTFRISKL